MSDEVKKIQETALELGIYKIVQGIATKGKGGTDFCEATWEGCSIKFREKKTLKNGRLLVSSITMPDGVVLYRCEEPILIVKGAKLQRVTNFRNGAWVERIKAYSEQLTLERQQAAEARAQKKQESALKPFTEIDF